MKIVDLQKSEPSLQHLLTMASAESVLLVTPDGKSYILEEADDFEREVEQLATSERFMQFLSGRSKETGAISIEQVAAGLSVDQD
jgi:hypothetical protein